MAVSLISSLIAGLIVGVPYVLILEYFLRLLGRVIIKRGEGKAARRVLHSIRVVFYGFLVIIELGIFGVNITSLLAGAGFLSIIVGLAVQGPLSNFFAGIYILTSRIVKKGERIAIRTVGSSIMIDGIIERIGFSHAYLRDKRGKLFVVPNTTIISSVLVKHDEDI